MVQERDGSGNTVLSIGPLDPTQPVEPGDPDVASRFAGKVGVHNKANEMIAAVQAANPRELRVAGALPRDPDRSRAIAGHLDEVQKLADTDDPIEGATVRGRDEDRGKIVLYVARAPSGRSYRGFVPYDGKKFRGTEADGGRLRTLRLRAESAPEDATPADRRSTEKADSANAELLRELQALRDRVEELEAEKEEAPDGVQTYEEPFEGYDELKVDDVSAQLAEADVETSKAILAYEEVHQDRKGVKDAAEKRLAELEAA